MKFQILTPTLHGLLDYAAAAGLIVLPFLLGIGEISALAQWLSVAAGFGLAAYSLATDYAFGVRGVLSFQSHLALDVSAAVAFIAAPFLFGWSGLVFGYYIVMATGVLLVVAVSKPAEKPSRAEAAS